ncbi:MAG: pentapeptide repeat-containing protein [bacterium]|nr:pentapeptide repeat-containing protein [bacterium]
MQIEMIAQDHRMIPVWSNLLLAYRRREEDSRRVWAAARAAVRWLFFKGRTGLVLSIGLGSVLGIVLAIQANWLFEEQNLKIDVQNHMIIVQSNLKEAERNIGLMGDLSDLINAVESEKQPCSSRVEDSLKYRHEWCSKSFDRIPTAFCVPEDLNKQIEALSNQLQPYRLIEGDRALRQLYPQTAIEMAWWERIGTWLGSTRPLGAALGAMPVPQLSGHRLSPERGELMKRLVAEQRVSKAFSRDGIILDAAFLPRGSNLSGVDLASASIRGADLTGVDLAHSVAVETDFEEAVLNDVDLKCASLTSSRFAGATMQNADLAWSKLSGADMSRANLGGAVLFEAEVANTGFYFTNLRGADLEGVEGLSKQQVSWACLDSTTKLPNSQEFSVYVHQQPIGCVELWGERERGELWIALEVQMPLMGKSVKFVIVGSEDSPEVGIPRYGRWDGASFKTDGGEDLLPGSEFGSPQSVIYWVDPDP